MADRPILATMTGEFYQPVRLHYKVLDESGLRQAFQRLQCIDYDRTQNRWVWLYAHEAKGIRFKKSYSDLPDHTHPIVLGSLFLRAENQLLLDLRSVERAIEAVPFYDRHIPRSVALLTEAEVVNKLFSAEDTSLAPASHFDNTPGQFHNPEDPVKRARRLTAGIKNPLKRRKVVMHDMNMRSKRPLPEIERLPVHYYEDGIHGFVLALKTRQIVAFQHWLGKTDLTLLDAIRLITKTS